MLTIGGVIRLSATDLGRFLSCRHLTALDTQVAQGIRPVPPKRNDPFLDLLGKRGQRHEDEYKQKLQSEGLEIVDLSEVESLEALRRTTDAMRRGMPGIAQGALGGGGWFGLADLLIRVEKPSQLGSWSYEVYDTKLARETRGTTILQLCLYSDLVGEIQGLPPEWFHVVTPVKREPYRFADYAAYYRLIRRKLLDASREDPAALEEANYPEPVDYCDVCRWRPRCEKRRRQDDHLSFVAGITRLQRQQLEANGVTTLERFGDLELPLPFKPGRGSMESLERAQQQARIQLEGRRSNTPVRELLAPIQEGHGLALLPQPSDGDIFLDLEGDHFAREGGREYLFGMTVIGPGGRTAHRKSWAHDDTQEKLSFETIVDEIIDLWTANPGMHVYHYAAYEPSAFKRLMGRHATRGSEMDRMLRAGLFVDLHSVVRQGLRASVESYSIKHLERFYGFKRATPLDDASSARRMVEFALEIEDPGTITPEARRLVEEYNREDCVSALELRAWLETLRAEHERNGITVPRPPVKDGGASEEVEDRDQNVQQAMDALLADVPLERVTRSAEQQARWLVAHLLEFHRREDKVVWWEFFRLCGISDEDELLIERPVVVGLEFVGRTPPVGKKRVPVDRYRFPPQEFQARQADDLKTQDGIKWGTVEDVDRAAGWIDVKKTQARVDDHPRIAFVHRRVQPEPIPSALIRLARDIIDNGLGPTSPSSVGRELLLGNAPRLMTGTFVPQNAENPLDFAIRVLLDLDHSFLAIQGPPGAGKTYTGARMIVASVARGLRVGVSAVSHKVMRKLLDEAVKASKEQGVELHCVHKDSQNVAIGPCIDEVQKSEAALAALSDGHANVVSGTAWLWSRPDAVGAVDVLFVDEAGQASLANVLALSQATRNLVLLGDPQQLEQPQRGTHPEGADASALEHVLGADLTIPPGRGIFLEKTWRLPPAICGFTSELFYEGRLETRDGLENQKLSGVPPYEGAGLWFVDVEHDGNTNSSPEEVSQVDDIVSMLLAPRSFWTNAQGEARPMTPDEILVIAPFNAQVSLLQDALGPKGVRVGTVDRFQGQEAAVVIYSMATSRPEDAPRGMEFLYDLNRLNVATSRARCACILVASSRLFEPDCGTPRQMMLANAMRRYLENAEP